MFRSRADAVRVAIDAMLRARHREAIDRQYVEALDALSEADLDVVRVRVGDPEPSGWQDIPW